MRRLVTAVFVVAVALMSTAASAQDITQRLYFLPQVKVVRPGDTRTFIVPKYLKDIPDLEMTNIIYGPEMIVLSCAGVTTAQHLEIAANVDVLPVPLVLSDAISLVGYSAVRARMEGLNVPIDDLTAQSTYLQVVRRAMGVFFVMQRFKGFIAEQTGTLADAFFANGVTLDTQLGAVTRRSQLLAAAQTLNLDITGIRNTTPLRDVLRTLGDQVMVQVGGVSMGNCGMF